MKTLPKIGQRVIYRDQREYEREPRICTGVVTKFYRTHDYDFDDDDEPIFGTERIRPVHEWAVAIKVDRPLPKWWAYGNAQDTFCPTVEHVEPETKVRRRA